MIELVQFTSMFLLGFLSGALAIGILITSILPR